MRAYTLLRIWFCKEVGKVESHMLATAIFWGQKPDKFFFLRYHFQDQCIHKYIKKKNA